LASYLDSPSNNFIEHPVKPVNASHIVHGLNHDLFPQVLPTSPSAVCCYDDDTFQVICHLIVALVTSAIQHL